MIQKSHVTVEHWQREEEEINNGAEEDDEKEEDEKSNFHSSDANRTERKSKENMSLFF